ITYESVFFFQAEDGIRDRNVTGVQTCALPISFRGTGQFIAHGSVELGYYNNNQIALGIYDHHKGPYATATINLADLNINPPLGHIAIPNSGALTDLWLDLADLNIVDTNAQFVGYGQFNEQAVIAPLTRHIANQHAHLIF